MTLFEIIVVHLNPTDLANTMQTVAYKNKKTKILYKQLYERQEHRIPYLSQETPSNRPIENQYQNARYHDCSRLATRHSH